MNGYKLGAGTLYIGQPGDDNFAPLGEALEGGFIETVEDHDAFELHELINTTDELTFTVKMSEQQMKDLFIEAYGILLDMLRARGHGRIAHLVTYARKRKTRKKNMHRAFRIPEKEEWQW